MSHPAISVVMGVHDEAEWLPATLDSVLGQTESDWEMIVVNDGSTDPAVARILTDYAHRDAQIRVIDKPHEGLTRALIAGCDEARGVYIARIDAGDAMCPNRLERQRAVLDEHERLSFVSCWTEICGPEWEPLMVKKERDTGSTGLRILSRSAPVQLLSGPTHHASVMFRASAYKAAGGYRAEFYFTQDWDLWYRLAEQGEFHQIPEVLQRVRLSSGGITAQARRMQKALGRLARDAMQARLRGESDAAFVRQAAVIRPSREQRARRNPIREAAYEYFIGNMLLQNRDPRCRAFFRRSLQRWPLSWRSWVGVIRAISLR